MLWNGMSNFFSRVMSGGKIVPQYIPVQPIRAPIKAEEEEEEVESISSLEPDIFYSVKTLLFTGKSRQHADVVVTDTISHNEVRNEVARLLEIHDVQECIFVQATDDFGLWYQYGNGISHGAVMGRNQRTGRFSAFNPDWMDVEDEILRHGHMIQASTQRGKKMTQKRGRPSLEEETPSPLKKQYLTRGESKRLAIQRAAAAANK